MIAVVTDSTCDIPEEIARESGVLVVPALVNIGHETLRDGVDISRQTFYERLPHLPRLPTTSAPGPAAFVEVYEQALARASSVISIHAASTLSGIYNAARLAARQVAPGRIHLIDSGQVSMGLGWAVLSGLEAVRQSVPLEGVIHSVQGTLRRLRLYALLGSLEYLTRSGRVNMVQLGLTNLLSIKPIVELREGVISSVARVRTWSRAVGALAERVRALAPFERLAVVHTNCVGSAHEFIDRLRDVLPQPGHMLVSDVTTVIGTHVGPGSIGFSAVAGEPTQ